MEKDTETIQTPTETSAALLLLAAGNSSRLGHPKQNLHIGESTLINHVLSQTANIPFSDRIVVLGAYAEDIAQTLHPSISTVYNMRWKEGMASSIRCGLERLIVNNRSEQVMVLLSDQPLITAELLSRLLLEKKESNKKIVACDYGNVIGVPALFDQSLFSEMMMLEGTSGAKQLIKKHAGDVSTVPFPEGIVDIDTEEDYQAWLTSNWDHFNLGSDPMSFS